MRLIKRRLPMPTDVPSLSFSNSTPCHTSMVFAVCRHHLDFHVPQSANLQQAFELSA